MSEFESLIDGLKDGTVAKKWQALSTLQRMDSSVIPLLVSVAVNASDQDLEWTLEGYDYAQGEGQNITLIKLKIRMLYNRLIGMFLR